MKISLQFHAKREEIAAMAAAWAVELNLHVAVERLYPAYSLETLGRGAAVEPAAFGVNVGRISLSIHPFDQEASTSLEFMRRNPHALTILVGECDADSLRESAIGAMTDDVESVKTWKQLRQWAKKSMYQGVQARNPLTGASVEVKGHYFTDGARRLAREGVRMLPAAGWVEYELR